MPRDNIEFQTADHVTLRGWFFRPPTKAPETRLHCLVMSHGFSALKEMELDTFAEYFTQNLPISCLVYDNRGFGDSDTKEGQPRHEILPSQQTSDISDAITYAQSRADVDPDRIGIWGSSLEALRGYVPSTHIAHISPTPLLMTVADNDVITPADIALEAYSRAREPKKLHIFPGGHFDGYAGKGFERIVSVQVDFLKEHFVG
ncbi:unnamed protein product [Aspergillus oryzae]|nr:unnamed protein product [Aspergillus oryzae]